MKSDEIRAAAQCAMCDQPFGKSGVIFWRVKLVRFMVDPNAMRRQSGLEMMMGSVAIARAMGPDEDIARELDSREITVCSECQTDSTCVAALGGHD